MCSDRKIHDSHPGCRHKVLTSNSESPVAHASYLPKGIALGLRWGKFIACYLQMNVTADLGASEGKRAVQERRPQDPGDSELLSNVLCRLDIQGGVGARMTLQLCLRTVLTPAGIGKCDAVSEGFSTKQGSILGSLHKQREPGIVTAPGRDNATTPSLHTGPHCAHMSSCPLWSMICNLRALHWYMRRQQGTDSEHCSLSI